MKTSTSPAPPTVVERLDVAISNDALQVHLHQQRYRLTLDQIKVSDKVLEVGTGLGAFSEDLSKASNYYRGIEYDEASSKAAKQRVANPDWITLGDAQSMKFPSDSFDVVVCLEVLEHLPNYRKALAEIARILRPGGKLIASIPYVKRGAPSRINTHHLYEPGEAEFKYELSERFKSYQLFYQRYSESSFESFARNFRLRRVFGLSKQYEQLSMGNPEQMKRILLDNTRSGMLLGIFVIAQNH